MNIYEIRTPTGVRKFTEYRGDIGTTVYRCFPSSASREDNSVPSRLRWRKRLKVVGIRDHTWHGGSGREPNAIADLDDGTWCFVWNLYEEIPATTSVPDAPPQMTMDNLREMFKGMAPPSKQAVPGPMGMYNGLPVIRDAINPKYGWIQIPWAWVDAPPIREEKDE